MAYSYPQNGPLYPSDFALMYGGPPCFEPTGPPTYDGMVAQREPTPAPQPEARAHTQSEGYLFPSDHTHINFILPTHAHSSSPNLVQDPSRQFDYTTMMIPTCMTIKELIHKLGANNGKEKHNGIQEIWPMQNKPGWKAGITRWANEPNAEKTIKAIGLDETRGADGENSTAWIRVLRSRDQEKKKRRCPTILSLLGCKREVEAEVEVEAESQQPKRKRRKLFLVRLG